MRWGKDSVWHLEALVQDPDLLVLSVMSYMKAASLSLCFHIYKMRSIIKHDWPSIPSWELLNTVKYRQTSFVNKIEKYI